MLGPTMDHGLMLGEITDPGLTLGPTKVHGMMPGTMVHMPMVNGLTTVLGTNIMMTPGLTMDLTAMKLNHGHTLLMWKMKHQP